MLLRHATHPLLLLACALAGGALGLYSPAWGVPAGVIGRLFVNLLEMAALPLLVVAIAFGLRNLLGLPHRGRRVLMALGAALLMLWLCGVAGALGGQAAGLGRDLPDADQLQLGQLVQREGGAAEQTAVPLYEDPSDSSMLPAAVSAGHGLIPDNVYAALTRGRLPAVLLCALIFGLAFASLERSASQTFAQQLEAVYRALEALIRQTNLLLPLLAFGMAAHLAVQTEARTLALLAGLLGTLLLASGGLAGLALLAICQQGRCSPLAALAALKVPLLITLVSPSPVAAVPATIDALSSRLGFSRGVAELLVPIGAVFLRAGAAVHVALIGVFVAQLYGRSISPADALWIGSLAALAALTVIDAGVWGPLSAAGTLLMWLQLPPEAVLPVLLLVDRLCEGPRNLTSLLCVGALTALVSGGLPSERRDSAASAPAGPWRFTLTGPVLAGVLACVITAGGLTTLAGVGVGMGLRKAQVPEVVKSAPESIPNTPVALEARP